MIFKANCVQVKETYNESMEPNPSYISSLASPMRRKHKDDLLVTKTMVGVFNDDFMMQPFLSPLFFRRTSTTPGRRISLLLTSFLARKLSWV